MHVSHQPMIGVMTAGIDGVLVLELMLSPPAELDLACKNLALLVSPQSWPPAPGQAVVCAEARRKVRSSRAVKELPGMANVGSDRTTECA